MNWRQPKRWYLAAAAVVAAGAVVAAATAYMAFGHKDEDAFTATYRLIREGTTYADVEGLLGPAEDEAPYPGSHVSYVWNSPDGKRCLIVAWYSTGELATKYLGAADGTVILSERLRAKPWWKRVLARFAP